MSYPKALEGNPKVIFFTDFDGTITLQDTNDTLTDDLGIGYDARRQLNVDCLANKITFRTVFHDMMVSITKPYDYCIEHLYKHVKLDPYFSEFLDWSLANNVPIVILSSGLIPVIRAVLEHQLGKERANKIDIIANHLVTDKSQKHDCWNEGGWGFAFRDETDFGHDKSKTIRPYAKHFEGKAPGERPVMLYAGDGVSDLSAARETDLLFAKKGRDLVTYCEKENVPFTLFEDWSSILAQTKELYAGRSLESLAKQGRQEAKESK